MWSDLREFTWFILQHLNELCTEFTCTQAHSYPQLLPPLPLPISAPLTIWHLCISVVNKTYNTSRSPLFSLLRPQCQVGLESSTQRAVHQLLLFHFLSSSVIRFGDQVTSNNTRGSPEGSDDVAGGWYWSLVTRVMGIQSRMCHPSQSQLLTCYFSQQDWSWLTDDLQRGSTSMMEPHPTAGLDCTCSGHRQCCQFHWSPRSRVIATATASAGVSHSRDVYAPHAGVLHLHDAMPLALEFHARATLCPSRWSYTLVWHCASRTGVPHLCNALPQSGRWLWSAFKRCTASPMRTADITHIRLSSDVVYQLWDHCALLQTVAMSCFQATCCLGHETVVHYHQW